MRALIQRVSRASVSVDGREAASIGRGYLVLLGSPATIVKPRRAGWRER